MKLHVQSQGKRPEEAGDELRASIGGDMGGNSVFGEHMKNEQLSQLRSVDLVVRRYEDTLLGESIDDDQNSGESEGFRKLLDEVHGDGIPGLLGDRELLESSVGLVSLWFVPHACGARLAEVPDKGPYIGPDVLLSDKVQGLVLTRVSGEDVVMLVP